MTVCCCLSLGIFIQIMFERMLQATGKTVYSMITQGVGAIVNIILDPILIFGLLGFLDHGNQQAPYRVNRDRTDDCRSYRTHPKSDKKP